MNALAPLPIEARQPPAHIDAEAALLGAILVNNSAYAVAAEHVKPEHFSEDLHGRVFDICGVLIGAGRMATPITVKPHLPEADLGGMSVSQYLVRLATGATTISGAKDYAKLIADASARRSMIAAANKLIEQAHDAPISVTTSDMASEAMTALHDLAHSSTRQDMRRDAGDSAAAFIAHARALKSGQATDDGARTGIPDLDRDTGGYRPGTLWVVAGRPGMGKTALAAGCALKSARAGIGSAFFSMEVPEEQLLARLMAEAAYSSTRPLSFSSIMRGTDLTEEEIWRLEEVQKSFEGYPLSLDFSPGLSVAEIAMRVSAEKRRMTKRGAPLKVVFVDYLKFIKATSTYRGQRVYEVGEITRGLKELARNEGICVVLLAQLNRALENRDRKDRRPQLADLRESGDLEADADVVAFIHRESYYVETSAEYRNGDIEANDLFQTLKNEADLIIGKNRAGIKRVHKLWCDMSASMFTAQRGRW